MKQKSLYGRMVSVCTILGVVAAGPAFFISSAQASPYTTAGSQDEAADQVQELGETFEQNDAPFLESMDSLEEDTILSQPQDGEGMEDRAWTEEEGLEEEPLEKIEGLEELPEESPAPLPAP